jgi:putative oxidoreductase
MLVASIAVHRKNGFFNTNNGFELPLLVAVAGIGISLTGPGLYSVDAVLGNDRMLTPQMTWIFLALGVIGGIGNLALRRPSPSSPSL